MIKGYILKMDNEVIFFDEKEYGAELNLLSLKDQNNLIPVTRIDNKVFMIDVL